MRKWEKNHNSVSIDYGPLTFSLKINERYVKLESDETAIRDSKWQKDADTKNWPSYEIYPDSPWNYGLVFDEQNLENSFKIHKEEWPEDNFPFTVNAVPIWISTKGRQIPQWKLDEYDLCGELKDSPVKSEEPTEDIELIPMGAARLRISSFALIGDGPDAHEW